MVMVFCRMGKKSNTYLIIDTEKRHFKYFKGESWYNSKAIFVKSEKDIDKIIKNIRDDGYALKIGG